MQNTFVPQRELLPPGVTLFDPPHLSFSREQPDDAYLPNSKVVSARQPSKLTALTTSNLYLGKQSPTLM